MYVETEMVDIQGQFGMRISPLLVAATGIAYYMLKDQEQQKAVPIVLRTVVNAQDISLLQSKCQPWYENFKQLESDDLLSFVGKRRLWQFKDMQVQVFLTIPEGTREQQKKRLDEEVKLLAAFRDLVFWNNPTLIAAK